MANHLATLPSDLGSLTREDDPIASSASRGVRTHAGLFLAALVIVVAWFAFAVLSGWPGTGSLPAAASTRSLGLQALSGTWEAERDGQVLHRVVVNAADPIRLTVLHAWANGSGEVDQLPVAVDRGEALRWGQGVRFTMRSTPGGAILEQEVRGERTVVLLKRAEGSDSPR